MSDFWPAVYALIPSIGVGILFYFAMRAIIRADRNERLAMAELDAQAERAEVAARTAGDSSTTSA
ncbi:hypothetical protein EQW78_02530 [Oerskovia turbata]|uniref:Uncharacterized protein n=1 Tax=Oerskovia turbata TaxID=1713 RepID=A0A4Q1L0L7_9CELL|nr:hypothetical protein [Oerskovia turbata]RXR26987.1 hypothetical protein EQW73_05890 [Oerskovia turbata]RXR36170.1 hypothetical protein EQW78_02530 [Oerskovia turbata]TGJ95396.1 hypothetical protein DLJ96_12530 [Actinotalea fermentans ATCC 43279 = JCM 9966 = DSM 3133]